MLTTKSSTTNERAYDRMAWKDKEGHTRPNVDMTKGDMFMEQSAFLLGQSIISAGQP